MAGKHGNSIWPDNVKGILGGHDSELLIKLGFGNLVLDPIDTATNGQRFVPPKVEDTPQTLFKPARNNCTLPALRYIRRDNPKEMLVYTDGCCLDNGRKNARAGFAVVYRPEGDPKLQVLGAIKSRLETEGADKKVAPQTSNRAELRAAIAALQFRIWTGEGVNRFVIATDSEYVVKGATEWTKEWSGNNWTTAEGTPVKNQDLWKVLIEELEKWSEKGMTVLFWLIPREQNTLADKLAKEAALLKPVEKFATISGVAC